MSAERCLYCDTLLPDEDAVRAHLPECPKNPAADKCPDCGVQGHDKPCLDLRSGRGLRRKTPHRARSRASQEVEQFHGYLVESHKTIRALADALIEACDGWESLWRSDCNDPPPARIAELRALAKKR